MTYQEALEYIHGISWTFCKPGLERTERLCELIGSPEKSLKFIHVAGTNGKGSFSSMLASILTEAGYIHPDIWETRVSHRPRSSRRRALSP